MQHQHYKLQEGAKGLDQKYKNRVTKPEKGRGRSVLDLRLILKTRLV